MRQIFKAEAIDSGERLLIFEFSNQTNTHFPSLLLQNIHHPPNSWMRVAKTLTTGRAEQDRNMAESNDLSVSHEIKQTRILLRTAASQMPASITGPLWAQGGREKV